MLVLSRKVGESILIGGHTRVVVAEIEGGRVRLGVEAPDFVQVDRAEIAARRAQFEQPKKEEKARRAQFEQPKKEEKAA